MEENNDSVTVVLIDFSCMLIANDLSVDTAQTLIALVSEDPANWAEATSIWPRYQTRAVCESIDSLPFEATDRDLAMKALEESEAWVAIDFPNKRVFSGGLFLPIERDVVFAMEVDDLGDYHCPLSIHLPPWWELHVSATPDAVNQPRQSPINKPIVDRDVLYGDALLEDIAARVLAVVVSEEWKNSDGIDQENARYPFTIQVHRDWLMTPRDDLGGLMPRQLLHGAIEWSDRVTWGQRLRLMDGESVSAIPNDWSDFPTAPMGSQEMCLYFDLCRKVIEASWFWCASADRKLEHAKATHSSTQLATFLRNIRDEWLHNSFEGGSPPSFIIECGRRRVPRGTGIAIHGIENVHDEKHFTECDCPICEMMADGSFGIGFTSIDGHHLELDDEFAFSMIETREGWEKQQQDYADFSAEMDRRRAECEAHGDTEDPFASAWTGIQSDDPLPGDTSRHLQMAFMVAEIVSLLGESEASSVEIKSLNESFANYRRSEYGQRKQSAIQLKAILQSLADRYHGLVSRSADLQSRIDEAERNHSYHDRDSDLPF